MRTIIVLSFALATIGFACAEPAFNDAWSQALLMLKNTTRGAPPTHEIARIACVGLTDLDGISEQHAYSFAVRGAARELLMDAGIDVEECNNMSPTATLADERNCYRELDRRGRLITFTTVKEQVTEACRNASNERTTFAQAAVRAMIENEFMPRMAAMQTSIEKQLGVRIDPIDEAIKVMKPQLAKLEPLVDQFPALQATVSKLPTAEFVTTQVSNLQALVEKAVTQDVLDAKLKDVATKDAVSKLPTAEFVTAQVGEINKRLDKSVSQDDLNATLVVISANLTKATEGMLVSALDASVEGSPMNKTLKGIKVGGTIDDLVMNIGSQIKAAATYIPEKITETGYIVRDGLRELAMIVYWIAITVMATGLSICLWRSLPERVTPTQFQTATKHLTEMVELKETIINQHVEQRLQQVWNAMLQQQQQQAAIQQQAAMVQQRPNAHYQRR